MSNLENIGFGVSIIMFGVFFILFMAPVILLMLVPASPFLVADFFYKKFHS